MREKKHYHVTSKSRADTAAVLRAAVAVYLLYLAWKIATASGADASFSQPVSLLIGGAFAAAALAFGWYTWRRYRADLRGAELTPEEEEELRREREMEP